MVWHHSFEKVAFTIHSIFKSCAKGNPPWILLKDGGISLRRCSIAVWLYGVVLWTSIVFLAGRLELFWNSILQSALVLLTDHGIPWGQRGMSSASFLLNNAISSWSFEKSVALLAQRLQIQSQPPSENRVEAFLLQKKELRPAHST